MKIIIAGCGRLGSGLARTLESGGHTVTVIDQNPAAFEALGPSFKGQQIAGVGFDRDVLLQAGIERADALAAVTSSDEANVIIARLAGQVFHVPKVVAQLYDQRKAGIYNRLGLQTIDPTGWAIKRVADLLCYSPLSTSVALGSGEVNIVEVEVPAMLVGRSVADLTVQGEVQVIAINRSNRTFVPTPETQFHERDQLHIAVSAASDDRLRGLLGLA
jgi:trk system potassium uptake protein TrkA